MVTIRRTSPLFLDDVRAQRADAGDLDFERVARLHPQRRLAAVADAFGRACGDDVARRQRGEVGAEGDDLRDRIDQLVGAGMLDLLAVQPRRQGELARVGNLVAGDEPWPERAGTGKILAGGDGEFLIIPHRAVDQDRITGDVVEGVFGRDVAPALADDQRQFAFIIEIIRYARADHGAVVADQRVGEADEHAWLLRQFAADLRRMGAIIDTGAEDFRRLWN